MSSNKRTNDRTKQRRVKRKRYLKKKRDEKIYEALLNICPETVEGQSRLPVKMTDSWYRIDYDEVPVLEEKYYFFRIFSF